MTRTEHLAWCKQRAIAEYDYYKGSDAQRNGLTSMMSDMSKHPETKSEMMSMLCLMQMQVSMNRDEFVKFINGFN